MSIHELPDTPLQKHLKGLGACVKARQWAGKKTAKQAWQTCRQPDWMFWWIRKTNGATQMQIVRTACDCARLVLLLVKTGEERPRLVIEAAEKWADNPTTENKYAVITAQDNYLKAAYAAAAADAYAAYAVYAAAAAVYAADAVYDAVYAAYAYAAAVYAAEKDKARIKMRVACCKVIRDRIAVPWSEPKSQKP